MPDRLLVDLGADGEAVIQTWPDGELPQVVSRASLTWPLDADALEDLRWYLEDYLLAPFGVWEQRGPAIQARLDGWGEEIFGSLFGDGPARFAYERARDHGLEVVFRSAEPGLLALPWELMRDDAGPVALGVGGISRSLNVAGGAGTLRVPGGNLRVLMVISRPAGLEDVGYQMVARPLLERLDAVRGQVDLTVLRPPTFENLRQVLKRAADAGEPFHVVHFDGHGAMPGGVTFGPALVGGRQATMLNPGKGVLVFEKPGGGSDEIDASKVASVLAEGKVPVAVLNACQSGAIGKELEASIATALLNAGCAAVVAMAYSVYAVAAAEFMASFYETLFTGASVGRAVTAGRAQLFRQDLRPSPKGNMQLADWLIPVHYMRKDLTFPQAQTARPAAAPSLDTALAEIREAPTEAAATDPLAAVDGLFVGRDDLFYQLEAAARLQRVVVLTGPGGTGKTELAKGFARWWRDTGGVSDPRLVFWHSFEPGVTTFGLDGVITSLGLAAFGADFALLDPTKRLGAVKQLLAQMRVLLVWDNFESVQEMPDPAGATPPLDADGCATLKGFLTWVHGHSASTVLITTRAQESWLGEVRRIPVGGLNRIEAAQYSSHLLAPYPAAQARRVHRSFGELLEWLDGHPLSMRLTLPRLDFTDPKSLLAALRGTVPLPAAENAEPNRTTSLPASITYSYAHLADQTRRLLPAVSLFHGVADEDVLAAFSSVNGVPERFAGVSKPEWTALLDDAARVGLLVSLGAGMYQSHPALPSYLAAGWQAEDPVAYAGERAASEQALCIAYAAFGRWLDEQIASGDATLAYAVLGLQRRTLGAMLGYALDHHAWADAAGIVRGLNKYWGSRGLAAEANAWADRILAATAEPGQDTPATDGNSAESLWLYTVTEQATRQKDAGQLDRAAEGYRRILAHLQGQPETELTRSNIAVLYHQLGMTVEGRGQLVEAESWYRKSFTIKEELGDRPGMAVTYHALGNIAIRRGRLDEAEDWYRKAMAIYEEFGNRPHLATAYYQLGMTAQERGQLEEARDWYRESLAIEEELGIRLSVSDTYYQLGRTVQDGGQLVEAEGWYRKSLTIKEELGDRPGMAVTYHGLGNIALRRRRLDEAEDWYRKAMAIYEEFGNRPHLAMAYHQLGSTAQDRGQLQEAEDWYRKSLAIYKEFGDRPRMASAYHQLGITAQERGQLDEAEDWYRKALSIDEELGNRPSKALTYAQCGLLAEDRGQSELALEWNVRCVSLFEEVPNPLTGTGPSRLVRLTRELGVPVLEETWRRVTGQALPQVVRDFIDSQPGED